MTGGGSVGLGVLCKPPRPGVSKTRLASRIGAQSAQQLSKAFLRDCVGIVEQARAVTPFNRSGFYKPQDAAHEIQALLGCDWPIEFADHGDLGATMVGVLHRLLQHNTGGGILMGADVPTMSPCVITSAVRALARGGARDVVIAPSFDGGYCLIGVKSLAGAEALFHGMTWSTSDVLAETLRRAHRLRLRVTLLRTQRDIDDWDDLRWLRAQIRAPSVRAPYTRQALDEVMNGLPFEHGFARQRTDARGQKSRREVPGANEQ